MTTWITNAWYVAGWDAEIAASAPLARTICGVPMMFYRKLDRNRCVAMRDACPHEACCRCRWAMREGDGIRCKYHGLNSRRLTAVAEQMPLKTDPGEPRHLRRDLCRGTSGTASCG